MMNAATPMPEQTITRVTMTPAITPPEEWSAGLAVTVTGVVVTVVTVITVRAVT